MGGIICTIMRLAKHFHHGMKLRISAFTEPRVKLVRPPWSRERETGLASSFQHGFHSNRNESMENTLLFSSIGGRGSYRLETRGNS